MRQKILNTKKEMSIHDLRDELSNRKKTNQPFLFKINIDLGGKIVETFMFFKAIEAFEICLEYINEHYGEGCKIVQGADIFMKTDKNFFKKLKEAIMVKEKMMLIKKWLDIKVQIV